MEEEVTILGEVNPTHATGFTPVPIRGRNSTTQARVSPLSKEQDECSDDTALTPTGGQKTCSSLPPSEKKHPNSTVLTLPLQILQPYLLHLHLKNHLNLQRRLPEGKATKKRVTVTPGGVYIFKALW